MLHVNNFANGALNPALSYVVSCVGCFLGLRCTTRARAYQGAARARWLALAALAIGTTGIWVMKRIGQSQAAQNQSAQGQARPWQAPPPQPYQPYQAVRDEPEPDAPGSLFRPRRAGDQR